MINDVSKVVSNLYIKQKDFFSFTNHKTNVIEIKSIRHRKEIITRVPHCQDRFNRVCENQFLDHMTSDLHLF